MKRRSMLLVLGMAACMVAPVQSKAPKAETFAEIKDMLIDDAYLSGGFPEKNATREQREKIALQRKANIRAIVEIFTHSLPPARKNKQKEESKLLFNRCLLEDASIYSQTRANTVFSHIDCTCTQAGQIVLSGTFAEGCTDLVVLKQRADMIREFIKNEDLRKNSRSTLREFGKHEAELLSRWASSESSAINKELARAKAGDRNKVIEWVCNTASTIKWGTVQFGTPTLGVLGAAAAAKALYNNKSDTSLMGYAQNSALVVAVAASLYAAKNGYVYGRDGNIKDLEERNLIIKSVKGFNSLVTTVRKLTQELTEHAKKESLPASFKAVTDMKDVVAELQKNIDAKMANNDPFSAALLLSNNVDRISTMLLFIGEMDAYLSMARHYRALQKTRNTDSERVTVDFCTFNTTSTTPYIRAEGYWNPIVPTKIVKTNNLELGGTTQSRNAVITGPNAGGKSFGLRGIIVQLMLSHSYQMAWARKFETTPFKLVIGQLNNIDDPAEGHSRLMSEVFNMRSIIQRINKLSPAKGEFAFVVTDELFTGTEVEIAVKISIEMAQVFAELKHVMYILATHYKRLTKLEEMTNGVFKNYHVEAYITESDAGNEVTYPFKWFYGPGKINVALDIMLLQMRNHEMENDVFYERLKALQARIKSEEREAGVVSQPRAAQVSLTPQAPVAA